MLYYVFHWFMGFTLGLVEIKGFIKFPSNTTGLGLSRALELLPSMAVVDSQNAIHQAIVDNEFLRENKEATHV